MRAGGGTTASMVPQATEHCIEPVSDQPLASRSIHFSPLTVAPISCVAPKTCSPTELILASLSTNAKNTLLPISTASSGSLPQL